MKQLLQPRLMPFNLLSLIGGFFVFIFTWKKDEYDIIKKLMVSFEENKIWFQKIISLFSLSKNF